MLISFGIRSDPIGPDYNSDPICYRVRLNEIGSELIFGSDWKKSDPITQKPVNILKTQSSTISITINKAAP